jgi:hypothetical protein
MVHRLAPRARADLDAIWGLCSAAIKTRPHRHLVLQVLDGSLSVTLARSRFLDGGMQCSVSYA